MKPMERYRTGEETVRHNAVLTRDEAGLPGPRLHDLRHNRASVAVMNGVDMVTVAKLLGVAMSRPSTTPAAMCVFRETVPDHRHMRRWETDCACRSSSRRRSSGIRMLREDGCRGPVYGGEDALLIQQRANPA